MSYLCQMKMHDQSFGHTHFCASNVVVGGVWVWHKVSCTLSQFRIFWKLATIQVEKGYTVELHVTLQVWHQWLHTYSGNLYFVAGPSGYDNDEPPVLDGSSACPHCHLSPCVTQRPPSWLRGSATEGLSNIPKRYKLYSKFWTLLGQLGVWSHPEYLSYKRTRTTESDRRDIMPDCVLTVS